MPVPEKLDPRIELGMKRFRLCEDAESELRKPMLDDLKFITGDQWPEDIRRQREMDKRPCLTINRSRQFLRQVTNSQRQNRVAASVSGVDDKSDPDTAEVFQGIIRHIEYASNGKVAYDTAGLYAAATGRGFFRLLPKYEDPKSFDQEIRIERISNPFMVYMDPASKAPDGSDAKFCFIVEELTHDEYKEQFPDEELSGLADFTSIGDIAPGWLSKESLRLAEYYYREETPDRLCEVRTPEGPASFLKSELKDTYEKLKAKKLILRERDTTTCEIKWCKFNAVKVLEETDVPGEWIPVVKVIGEEFDVNGKLVLSGVIRDAKDPQRMYNYQASKEAEAIAIAPSAPWLVAAGQIEKYKAEWQNPNSLVLRYDPKDVAGTAVPAPSRITAEPAIQAITESRKMAAEDMKATTGIYDPSLGNKSNETSGIAIGQRQQQADTSNFHYVDNLTISITHGCRIMLAWIPYYYSAKKMVRIIGEDETPKVIRLQDELKADGVTKKYNLSVGKYDVICKADRSFDSKKEQASQQLLDLSKAIPQLGMIAPDLIIRGLNIPYGDELAKRAQKALPPQLQDQPEGQQPIPPEIQQAMSALNQQNQQLSQALEHQNQLNDVEQRKADNQIRLEQVKFGNAKELALLDRETALLALEVKADTGAAIETLKAEIQNVHAELDAIRGRSAAEHSADLQMTQAEHAVEIQPPPEPAHGAEAPA